MDNVGQHDKPAHATVDPVVRDDESEGRLITLPVVACGAGLFSDGYINNVCVSLP